MTERLSQLLHDEAAHLTPPPPDPAVSLIEGRRLRRRQRITAGVAAAAVAAVVVTTAGFVAMSGIGDASREVAPAGPAQAEQAPAAYGVGSEVHVGDSVATVPDTVHSLHYTSLGVLVRSNPNDGASDGSGPESLTLVRWDGSTTDLGTIPEGVGPATDPARDVYVLAEARGDGFVAVVRDAASGETVQEQPLPDLPPSYWEVPPLGLSGGSLYVGYRKETVAIDLATGEQSTVPGLSGGIPDVRGGRTVTSEEGLLEVLDVASGETVLSLDFQGYAYGTLSPDGRFLRFVQEETFDAQGNYVEPEDVTVVHDLSSGERREFPGAYDWGWTADGDLFKASGDTLTTCDVGTGECTRQPITPPLTKDADLRLGGRTYES
jgi:hypothetical protein